MKRGLVMLPCRGVGTTFEVIVHAGSGRMAVPNEKSKLRKAIQAYCSEHTECKYLDITVEVTSAVPAGIGMGSSTSDIVSCFRALNKAFGRQTNEDSLLRSVMKAENACDSTMLELCEALCST